MAGDTIRFTDENGWRCEGVVTEDMPIIKNGKIRLKDFRFIPQEKYLGLAITRKLILNGSR